MKWRGLLVSTINLWVAAVSAIICFSWRPRGRISRADQYVKALKYIHEADA